ncbi:MAG: gas vesicle protein K [Pseudomonadota bacterium]
MSVALDDLDAAGVLSVGAEDVNAMLNRAVTDPANGLGQGDGRLAIDPDNVERDLAKLVLVIVELLRRLMEAQALSRMERGTLQNEEIERLGEALFKAKAKVEEMREHFGIPEDEFNIDLGPIGRVL